MNIEQYLSNFFKGTKNPSLKAMEYFMEKFSHPEKKLKFIHIAGTNGKGSVAEMINNILVNAGYKVGKFMSPHLIKYNERIAINNKNISDDELEELIQKVKPEVDRYNEENDEKITLFELETTMAILYFYENNCDIVVMETGLGGLYDCTNIINPLVSIITSIGYDHMDILGNSLLEIAEQKAGIIKPNSHTIFPEQEQDVNTLIKNTCESKKNILHLVDSENISNYSYNENYQKFDYKNYKGIEINLKGEKQIVNGSICLECVDILREKGYIISDDVLRESLKTVVHKARFEKLQENPTIIYDGAHNIPAIKNFTQSIEMYYKHEKKVYIFSILKRKDYKSVLEELVKDNKSTFIFTDGSKTEEYVPKEELFELAKQYDNDLNLYTKPLEEAINFANENYKNSIIFIVGSFYIYGDVIKILKEIRND